MGGFGSGRDEYATTPTVGECHRLEVDDLTCLTDRPGGFYQYTWRDEYGHGEPVASVGIWALPEAGDGAADVDRATALRLEYTITDGSTGEEREHEYRVPLEHTECNFGGSRPWFRCPGVVDGEHCGRRAGKLYRPPRQDLFLCRECYDLGYQSARASGNDMKQAELRFRRAFAKADAKDRRPHPNSSPYFPERPSGMHTETFTERVRAVREARSEWHDVMMARLRSLDDKHNLSLSVLD